MFQIDTNGGLTSLACFAGTNGAEPFESLAQDSDGFLYGTTVATRTGEGTVFAGQLERLAPPQSGVYAAPALRCPRAPTRAGQR